ncbi:hypothetical protein JCM21900_004860 [Sporobolomyces salmonicolor]
MSVFARNPFAALGDDDVAPAPAPAPKAAPAPAPAAPKAAPKQTRGDGQARGGRKVFQGDREVAADVPAGEGAKEDRAKNFARSGGRGGRAPRGASGNPRGNAGTYQGGNRPRRENGGGRPFDRQSQTGRVDSEKAEAQGWGADDGKKELEAEVLGESDAKAEKPVEGAATPVREAPIEEEDNTQTYEEYLAAQAAKKLNIAALPEARKPNEGQDDSQWASAQTHKKGEQEEEWFMGAPKAASAKQKKQKEGKTFIEIDAPVRKPRENERGAARGGRGGRGRGEGRGRGGATRGGAPRAPRQDAPAVPDASAFPALA